MEQQRAASKRTHEEVSEAEDEFEDQIKGN